MECIEEKLIELVRKKPILYDTSHSDYMKTKYKQEIWMKIASKLNLKNGNDAKTMWTKLRNNHRDALRRQKRLNSRGIAVADLKQWKFQAQMEFLLKYMVNENRDTNFSIDSEISEQPESDDINENEIFDEELLETNIQNDEQTTPTPPPAKKLKKNEVEPLMKKVLEQREHRYKERKEERKKFQEKMHNDELYFFFMSMYEQTKKMPPASQHSVKRNVFHAVSEEEGRLLNIPASSSEASQQRNFQQGTSTTPSSPSPTFSSSAYAYSPTHNDIQPHNISPNYICKVEPFDEL